MKKTLYFYIFREIAAPFLLGMTTFTAVLLMGRLMKLADMVVARGVPISDVLRMVLYLLPYFSVITIPMAFLLALLLAFGRLSADSEIIAMKASGIGLYQLLAPAFASAFLAYIATTVIALYALPWGSGSFKKLVHSSLQSQANITIKEAVFNDEFPGIVLYVDRYDDEKQRMYGILIQDDRDAGEPTTVFAAEGVLSTDPVSSVIRLQLVKGAIHRSLGKGGYRAVDFDQYDLSIDVSKAAKALVRDETEMATAELLAGRHAPGVTQKLRLEMGLEFHRRFALPVACLVFVFIGLPLGIQNQRAGRGGGFAISIIILLLYYMILSAGKGLGERGTLSPAVAMWAPNGLFLSFGLYLFQKTASEQHFFLLTLISDTYRRVRKIPFRRRSTP